MLQRFLNKRQPKGTHEDPYRREIIPLQLLHQEMRQKIGPRAPHNDTYRGETIQM